MKQLAGRFLLFFHLVFIGCAITACKSTSETERAEASTVIGLAGHARYHDSRGEKWRDVKVGSFIPPGSVIQTDEGSTNSVQLSIGRRLQFFHSFFHPDFDDLNHLTLNANSVLKLDRVTAKTVSSKKISDIRLILSMGSAYCEIGHVIGSDVVFPPPRVLGPKLETITPQPGKSYFEIRSGNVVMHAEYADFSFFALKGTSLLSGVAVLEFTDSGTTKDLFSYQTYNFVTGETGEMNFNSTTNSAADFHWHYLRTEPFQDGPRFKIPQRAF